MDTFELGGDLEVRRLGFGAMRAEGDVELLRRVVELGINLIDTADAYDSGDNEELVARALHPYPDGLVIATKAGHRRPGGDWTVDGRPEWIREACEQSLRRLKLERIDLYQLHRPDPEVPVSETLGAFKQLQDEGKVRHVGVSNFSSELLREAREVVEVVSVQNEYNLGDRRSEDVLQECEADGIGFIPWYPLATGDLARPGGPLDEIARERDVTPGQVALAWLLAHSPVMLPIPGTSSIEHLEENVAATRLELADDELERIEALAARPRREGRPGPRPGRGA